MERVRVTGAETPKCHPNPLYPSLSLRDAHFVGGCVSRFLRDAGEPCDSSDQ